VFDLTKWLGKHPGGRTPLNAHAGIDGSKLFEQVHGGVGPLLMIAEQYPEDVVLVGEFDDPNAVDTSNEVVGQLLRENMSQKEYEYEYTIRGAVDFEETVYSGKSEVVKVTSEQPTTTLWISGQVATEESLGKPVKEQAMSALNVMRDEINKAGGKLEDVVKINCYIVDMDQEKITGVVRSMNDACNAWGRPYDLLSGGAKVKRHDMKDLGVKSWAPSFRFCSALLYNDSFAK